MKLKVTCKICGRTLTSVDKDSVSESDLDEYQKASSCEVDGPIQLFDDVGDPIPLDYSNIIVVKTLE